MFLAKSSGTIAGLNVVDLTYGAACELGFDLVERAGLFNRFSSVPCVEDGERVAAGSVVASADRPRPDPANSGKGGAELCATHVGYCDIDSELR